MKAVDVCNVSYRYPGSEGFALEGFDFQVEDGEFVVVTGASGCGKSTLLKLLNGLIPHYLGGELKGSVRVFGVDTLESSVSELSSNAGFLFQEPEDQVVMSKVDSEIAFALENACIDGESMREIVCEVMDELGVGYLRDRSTGELSGGELQKVMLCAVMAAEPRLLLLDEPTSQLDPGSRREFYELVAGLNRGGVTVVAVEHNTSDAEEYADRVVRLEEVQRSYGPLPAVDCPRGPLVLSVDSLSAGYNGEAVIEDVSFDVCGGECLVVTGPNGCGKSTLVKHFNALMKPLSGSVTVCGVSTSDAQTEDLAEHVAYLPQNPSEMLFCESVLEEVEYTVKHMGSEADAGSLLDLLGLSHVLDRYPRDLSVGERQRVAFASVLASGARLLVLDEPTRGIDAFSRRRLVDAVRSHVCSGGAAVIVTQDMGLVKDVGTSHYALVK